MKKFLSLVLSLCLIISTVTVLGLVPTAAEIINTENLIINGDGSGVNGKLKYTEEDALRAEYDGQIIAGEAVGWRSSSAFYTDCKPNYPETITTVPEGYYSNFTGETLIINNWRQAFQDVLLQEGVTYRVSAKIAANPKKFAVNETPDASWSFSIMLDNGEGCATTKKPSDCDWFLENTIVSEKTLSVEGANGEISEVYYANGDFKYYSFIFNSDDFINAYGISSDENGLYPARFVLRNDSGFWIMFEDVEIYAITEISGGIMEGSEKGGCVQIPQNVIFGEKATFKATPYFGNRFIGWYDENGDFVSDSATFQTADHAALYAKFSNENLLAGGGFETEALGDTSPVALEERLTYSSAHAPTFEIVENTDNTALFGNHSLKYYSTASAANQAASQYDLLIPVTVEKNKKYLFRFYYKNTTANRVGFTITKSAVWDDHATIDYSFYHGTLGQTSTNTWSYGYQANGKLKNSNAVLKTHNAAYSNTDWNEMQVLFDSLENEGTLYLVIGMMQSADYDHTVYLDNLQFSELSAVVENGSFYTDSGYYTVSGANNTGETFRFTTGASGSAVVYDDVRYTVKNERSDITYTAVPTYGNGFIGWYEGDKLISQNPYFISTLALTPRFDKKNLISFGDFENPEAHESITNEINGYLNYSPAYRGTASIVSTKEMQNTNASHGEYALALTPSALSNASKQKALINIPVTVEKNTDYIFRFSYKFDDSIADGQFNTSNKHYVYMSVDGTGANGKIPWSNASNTVKFTMHSQYEGVAFESNAFKNGWSWGGSATGFGSMHAISDNGTGRKGYWQDVYLLFNPQEDANIFKNGSGSGTAYISLGTVNELSDVIYLDNVSVAKAVKNASWNTISSGKYGEVVAARFGEQFYWYTPTARSDSQSYRDLDRSNTFVPDMYIPVTASAFENAEFSDWTVDGNEFSESSTISVPAIGNSAYKSNFIGYGAEKVGYGNVKFNVTEKGGQKVYNYEAIPYYGNNFIGWYTDGGEFISANTKYSSVNHSTLTARFDGGNTLANGDLEYSDDLSFVTSLTDNFSIKKYAKNEGNGKYYLSLKNTSQDTTRNAIILPVKKNTEYVVSFDMKINDLGANGWFRSALCYELNNWSAVASLGRATQTFLNPNTGYTIIHTSDANGRLQPGGGLDSKNYTAYFENGWIHFTTTFNSGSDSRVFGGGNEGTLYLMLYNFNNGVEVMIDNIVFGSNTDVKAYVDGFGTAHSDKTTALPGDTVTFTATADYGSAFDGWYSQNTRVSQERVFKTDRHLSLTARFKNYGVVSDGGFENGTTSDFVAKFDDVTFQNVPHAAGTDSLFGNKQLKVNASARDYLSFYIPAKVEANTKYLIHFSYKVEATSNTRTDIMVGPKNSWSSFTSAKFYASSAKYSYSPDVASFGSYMSDNLSKHFGDGFIEMNVIVDTADELIDGNLYLLLGARNGATFYIDNLSVTKISDISPYMIGATLTTETSKYYHEGTLSYASGLNYILPSLLLKEIGTVAIPTQLIPAGSKLTRDTKNVSVARLAKSSGLRFDAKQFYATFRNSHEFNVGVKLSARSYSVLSDMHGKFEWTFYSENDNAASSINNGVYNRSVTQIRRLLARQLINTFEGAYPADFFSDEDVGINDNVAASSSVTSDEAWNFIKRNAYLYGLPDLRYDIDDENLFINGDFEDTNGYLGAIRENLVNSTGDGLSYSGGNSGNAVWYDYDHKGWIYYSGTGYQFSYGMDHSAFFNFVDASVTKPHSGDYSLRLNTRAGTASYIIYDLEPNTEYELSYYWKGTDTLGVSYTYVYPYIHEFFGFETQYGIDVNDSDKDGNTTESLPVTKKIDGIDYRYNVRIDQRYFAPDVLSLYSEALTYDSNYTFGNNDWQKKTLKFNSDSNTAIVFGVHFNSKVSSGNIFIDDFVIEKADAATEHVRNGDFRDGTDHWNGYAATYKVGGQSTASFNQKGQSIWQTLKVERDTDYTLTVKAKTREKGALRMGVTNIAHQTLTPMSAISNTALLDNGGVGTVTYTVDFHVGEYQFVNLHLASLSNSPVNIFSVEVKKVEKSIIYDKVDFEGGYETINIGTAPLAEIAKTNNVWYSLTTSVAHSGKSSLLMKATATDTNAKTNYTTMDGELLKHPLYQEWSSFHVIPGNHYKLSYYVKSKTAGNSYESSIRYLNQSEWDYTQAIDKKTVTLSNTDWTYVEHTFSINFPIRLQYLADFVVSANDATVADLYFDDIVFEEALPRVEEGTPEKLYTEAVFNLIPDNDLENGGSEYVEKGASLLSSGAYSGTRAIRVNAGKRIVLPIKTYVDYNYIPSVYYTFSAAVRKSSAGNGYVGISYDGTNFYKSADGSKDGSKLVPSSTNWTFTGFSYNRETVSPTYLIIECTSGYIDVDMMSLFTHQHAYKNNPNLPKDGYDYDNLSGAVANGGSSVNGAVSLSLNNSTPLTTLFTGIGKTVYHGFVEECMGREYTDAQRDFEIKMMKDAGMSMARTMFRSYWAYTGDENDPWDWDSPAMQDFYEWARRLAEDDIEIAIIPCAAVPGFVYGSSSGPDVSYLYPKKLDENGDIQYTLSWGVLHPAIDFELACERYSEFFAQAIEALYERGITNVTHALTFNEPCHPNGTLYKGAHAELMLRLVEACVDKISTRKLSNGQTIREYITLVGPNQANRTNAGLADFFLENSKYGLDLYDIWTTHMVSGDPGHIVGEAGDNYDFAYTRYSNMMGNFLNKVPFWCDEFAVAGYRYEYDKNSNEQEQRWWGVNYSGQYAALINSGMSGGILWQLIDNNWSYLSGSGGEFMYGIHMTGAAHAALQTQTPYYSYYAVTLLTKYLSSRDNGSSFKGTSNNNHVHIAGVRLADGNWSILVVNSTETAQNIKINMTSSLGGKTMYRHVYEAATIEPDSAAKILDADKTFTNVTSTINDHIPAGSVVVYTTVKG